MQNAQCPSPNRILPRFLPRFFAGLAVALVAAFGAGCPPAPCCTSDADCTEGLGCFEGECTYPCRSSDECDDDEICIRPEGAASSFGVCLLYDREFRESVCKVREPLPPPDAGPPLEPDPGPQEPDPGPQEPDPPPPCVNDVYEPNDLRGLGQTNPASPSALTLCGNDEDWFLFDLDEGDRIRFRIEFRNATSDIELEFYNPEPFSGVIASSTTTQDFEEVNVTALSSGFFAARVFRFGGAPTEYLMFVEIEPAVELDGGPPLDAGVPDGGPPPCDQSFEPNNSPSQAANIEPGPGLITAAFCPDGAIADVEYYSVLISDPSQILLNVSAAQEAVAEIRSPSGELLAIGTTDELVGNAPTPGTYSIALFADRSSQPMPYSFTVTTGELIPDAGPPPDSGPGCDRGSDEPNDTPDQALSVPLQARYAAKLCRGDEDWYQFSLSEGETLRVLLPLQVPHFYHGPPPATVPLQFSSDVESAFIAPDDGTYFVRIPGPFTADYEVLFSVDDAPLDAGVPDAGPGPDAGVCVDDSFEPNDGIDQATFIPVGSLSASVCGGDEDFFAFTAVEGQIILLEASVDVPGDDFVLQLFGPNGFVTEGVPSPDGQIPIVHPVNFGGRYAARLFSLSDNEVDYSLRLQLLGDPGCVSDSLEPNDFRESPAPAPVNEDPIALEICDDDRDFFFVDAEVGEEIIAQIFFSGGGGDTDIDMRLHGPEPGGSQVDSSQSTSGEELVSHVVTQPGRYVIEVFGFSGAENEYTLQVFVNDQQCVNDQFEPNNRRFDATNIEGIGNEAFARLCPGDIDFYEGFFEAGAEVILEYDFFFPLRLRVQQFGQVIGESSNGGGFESIIIPEEGFYTIRVDSVEVLPPDILSDYFLFVTPGFGCVPDEFEPNDSFAQASSIGTNSEIFASYCDQNIDMYRIQPGIGSEVFIDFFTPFTDELTISLVNETTFEFETINVNDSHFFVATSNRYLMVVTGPEDADDYEIFINEF